MHVQRRVRGDAPEVAHPASPAECHAEEATHLLEELAPVDSPIELVTDSAQPHRDRYDRMLRYAYHADVDVSGELLVNGAARRYGSDHELARGDAYAAAEDAAHDAGSAGSALWGNC